MSIAPVAEILIGHADVGFVHTPRAIRIPNSDSQPTEMVTVWRRTGEPWRSHRHWKRQHTSEVRSTPAKGPFLAAFQRALIRRRRANEPQVHSTPSWARKHRRPDHGSRSRFRVCELLRLRVGRRRGHLIIDCRPDPGHARASITPSSS